MGAALRSSSGYSEKPLATKLGIKEHMALHAVGAPKDYLDLLAPLPQGVELKSRLSDRVDLVHLFTTERSALSKHLAKCREVLRPTAAVWVSWPKKASRVPTDITEDTVRDVALPLGFVDVKVCAVTEVWSGLKLVVRKEHR